MDITVTTEIKNENIYIPFEKFNMESGIRIKIEQDAEVEVKLKADTKIKIGPQKHGSVFDSYTVGTL